MKSLALGYAFPSNALGVSPEANVLRSAVIAADPSHYELPTPSRTIINQGELAACVSCALSAAMEILNQTWSSLSPLFHYYVTRYQDGGANAEGFLFLDNALATLTVSGICVRSLHDVPYTVAGAATQPSQAAYDDGQTRALGRRGLQLRYRQVDTPSTEIWIREQLHANCPVLLGIQLPISYPESFLDANFKWQDPDASPRSTAGHCLLVTGYDDTRESMLVQDCRGVNAFADGRWWIGYGVVDSTIVQEAYCLIP